VKRIYLLRHAKSSWKDDQLRDHDRPLAGRGKRAAKAMARHLRDEGIDPQLVLCSTARRARDTLERIEPALGRRTVHVERDLYGASAQALLERLRAVPDRVGSVMVIGHNPGLEDLALELARDGPLVGDVEAKFPTAALATLTFAGSSWARLGPAEADLVAFVRPRDLEG
jgi:phosphohistidine phosphatase